MIKSSIVTILQSRLGNRTDTETLARINSEMDMAQFELEQFGGFTPWFLLSENATYAMTIGEQRVPIPTDMIQEYEEGALYYGTIPLVKADFDDLVEEFGVTTGAPQAYALVNEYFVVFPVPDAVYTLTQKYYQKDAVPSSVADAGESKWMKNAPDWLIAKTGAAVARYIKDTEAASLFATDISNAEARVYEVHLTRAEINIKRVARDV